MLIENESFRTYLKGLFIGFAFIIVVASFSEPNDNYLTGAVVSNQENPNFKHVSETSVNPTGMTKSHRIIINECSSITPNLIEAKVGDKLDLSFQVRSSLPRKYSIDVENLFNINLKGERDIAKASIYTTKPGTFDMKINYPCDTKVLSKIVVT